MAEFPALPIWTDAYLADTRHLSTEEHGAYLLLLFEAWRRPSCSLPDSDVMLARLAGLSQEKWLEIKEIVFDFWQYDGRSKTWTQKRLLKEREFVAKKSASQRDKAAKRWKKTENDNATALPEAMPDGCPGDAPTPTPTTVKEEANASSKKKGSRLPENWQLPRSWGEWATAEGMDELSVRREGEKFRDYWLSVPGQKGVKRDWKATWRNWVRKFMEDRAKRNPHSASKPEIPHGKTRKNSFGQVETFDARVGEWYLGVEQ